mgnify:CR=1 FL=1
MNLTKRFLTAFTSYIQLPFNNCAVASAQVEFDQIFTDINGWSIIAGRALENYAKYRLVLKIT